MLKNCVDYFELHLIKSGQIHKYVSIPDWCDRKLYPYITYSNLCHIHKTDNCPHAKRILQSAGLILEMLIIQQAETKTSIQKVLFKLDR